MTPLGDIISNTCFRYHNLCKKYKNMVKLSQIEEYKNRKKKTAVFHCAWGLKRTQWGDFKGVSPLEAGFEGAQPLATFWNLCGFRVPGNDILALDEVQTVLYTHIWSSPGFCIGQRA